MMARKAAATTEIRTRAVLAMGIAPAAGANRAARPQRRRKPQGTTRPDSSVPYGDLSKMDKIPKYSQNKLS